MKMAPEEPSHIAQVGDVNERATARRAEGRAYPEALFLAAIRCAKLLCRLQKLNKPALARTHGRAH